MRSANVLMLAALIWGGAIFTRTPQRQQELRVLITARNMVQHQDWLHFEFQNQPRYRKPPLAYWVAAAGFTCTGQTRSAWAGRLFFVLIALAGLWLYYDLAGDLPALLLLFTYGSLVYAPLAETDFLQLTGMILSFWGWSKSRGWVSGAGMALAVLSKGPGGLVIPLLTFLLCASKTPRTRAFWTQAVLLPILAGGGWIFYLQVDPVASAALAADVKATFLQTAHRNPLPYYMWTLPLVMMPVVFLLPWIRNQEPTPDARCAKTWFWVTFFLLTLTVSKQRHYALMLLPPACWWLGLKLPRTFPKVRHLVWMCIGLFGVSLSVSLFSTDARHAAFLRQAAPLVEEANTLHVVGINSARFDFHLGRHVENTDSTLTAYRRAAAGDGIVTVQKSDAWKNPKELPSPELEDDDGSWIRRVYKKQ